MLAMSEGAEAFPIVIRSSGSVCGLLRAGKVVCRGRFGEERAR